ncbi:hypothetical protein DSM112329_03403 [Paraconexibacter sp. AEG42_29]|uniref:Transglutaminase-like domain-containing protein n=1 Tax=Paraconexibacter sp. AEG42_29 TaxID=2997339 RepID=A0AAU7AXZ2_9ACTN
MTERVATPPTHVDPPLRSAVLGAGLCGLTATMLSGVVPLALLPVAAVLLIGAALLAGADPEWRQGAERIAIAVAVASVVFSVPGIMAGGPGGLRESLGPLLIGVQLAQAVSWTTVRNLQTGLLVAVGLLLTGASFAPDLVAGLPLLAGWTACLVAVVLLVGQRARASAHLVAPQAAVLPAGTLASTAALAVVIGMVAFLLVPVPVDDTLQRRASAGRSDESNAGRARAYTGSALDTSVRGELSDRPLAEVDHASPRLWRDRAFTAWDGRTWTATSPEVGYPGSGSYRLSGAAIGRTDTVTLLTRGGTVWAPGQIVALDAAGPLVGDSTRDGGFRLPRGTTGYRVSTAAQDLRGLDRDAAVTGDPALLALPRSTTRRTRELAAQITRTATSTHGAVLAIERWLADNATYRLDSPVPAPGEDAVDRFLFVDRTGFCEQFAAAEVVLLRAAGIPARLVTGLAYGMDRGDGTRRFREKDLHAWVEVPFVRAGWVASDPTAGAALAEAAKRSFRERIATAMRTALDATLRFPGGRDGLAAALLALTGAGWLWRRRTTSRPVVASTVATGVGAPGTAPPALAAFLRLDRRLAQSGRAPAESLTELGGRLGATGQRARALAVVEQECYGPTAPDPAEAVAVLDDWNPQETDAT